MKVRKSNLLGIFLSVNFSIVSNLTYAKEDQTQTLVDYGFWFESEVRRWQEFVPSEDRLERIDLWITKVGSPGNVYIQLTDTNFRLISSVKLQESDVTSGWITVIFSEVLTLDVGRKYRINVFSDRVSPSPNNRYFWRGSNTNSYGRGALNDVIKSWPNYDYSFVTYCPTEKAINLSLPLVKAAIDRRSTEH